MKKLKIITGEDNEILRRKSKEVKTFDSKLKSFAKAMRKTMDKANGLGLAAPQVGENVRMFVMIHDYDKPTQKTLTVINPEILYHCEDTLYEEEGCLSLPKQFARVERWARIKVRFNDVEGNEIIMDMEGLNAIEFQHESDHLDGVLFVDRVKENLVTQGEGEMAL